MKFHSLMDFQIRSRMNSCNMLLVGRFWKMPWVSGLGLVLNWIEIMDMINVIRLTVDTVHSCWSSGLNSSWFNSGSCKQANHKDIVRSQFHTVEQAEWMFLLHYFLNIPKVLLFSPASLCTCQFLSLRHPDPLVLPEKLILLSQLQQHISSIAFLLLT